MRWLPIFAIIILPFTLESFLVAILHPKLRLFEMNRLSASLKRFLDSDTEKLSVIRARAHIIDVATVTMAIPISVRLNLVVVFNSVEMPFDIILVISPGDTGHHMDAISVFAPRLHSLRECRPNAVSDGNVGAEIATVAPRLAGLKTGALKVLVWIRGNRRFAGEGWTNDKPKERHKQRNSNSRALALNK